MILYIRMFFILLISLYTSRVVLDTLGAEDYGIYNVVGGIIVMFGFINNAMSSATSRFITIAIGNNDAELITKVFSSSILIHIIIALIVVLLGETVGLWFFSEKLQIPEIRKEAAMWVYQFAIVSSIIMIISIPYNAVLVAYEKMSALAYISIIDAVLRLMVSFAITVAPWDKLITYSVLLLFVQLLIRIIYGLYCTKNFQLIRYKRVSDKKLCYKMISFASWSLFGCMANVCYTQGLNVLLNIFWGPVVNAARGIAVQVQSVVNNFASNFQTAVNPQIIKYFAQKEMTAMFNLMCTSSKFSFYLLFMISLPIIFTTDILLSWWLKDVPDYTVIFLRLMLVTTLIDSVSNSLMRAADATGKIKKYHIIVGGILILILPISYVCLALGFQPYCVFIVHIIFCTIALVARLRIIKSLIGFPVLDFLHKVIVPIGKVVVFSVILPLVLSFQIYDSVLRFFIIVVACLFSGASSIFLFGLTNNERKRILRRIFHKLN